MRQEHESRAAAGATRAASAANDASAGRVLDDRGLGGAAAVGTSSSLPLRRQTGEMSEEKATTGMPTGVAFVPKYLVQSAKPDCSVNQQMTSPLARMPGSALALPVETCGTCSGHPGAPISARAHQSLAGSRAWCLAVAAAATNTSGRQGIGNRRGLLP